jgi:predicted nucleic acid-binding protein
VDRIFLDANVLFSAAYHPQARLRQLWELSDTVLLTSAYAVEEARRNLDSPQQRVALEQLLHAVQVIAPGPGDPITSLAVEVPAKDRLILLAAIAARATPLITGDFRHFGRYYGQRIEGVLILPPAQYLRSHSGEAGRTE